MKTLAFNIQKTIKNAHFMIKYLLLESEGRACMYIHIVQIAEKLSVSCGV